MEQLAQSPWSFQTTSKSCPYLGQTWVVLYSSSSIVAAPNWAAWFSACHPNQPASTGLELLAAFKISHWNFWFPWLQWLESYWKLLPSFAPSLFLSLSLLSAISRSQLIAEPVLSQSLGRYVLQLCLGPLFCLSTSIQRYPLSTFILMKFPQKTHSGMARMFFPSF